VVQHFGSLEYKPCLEPLRIFVKQVILNRELFMTNRFDSLLIALLSNLIASALTLLAAQGISSVKPTAQVRVFAHHSPVPYAIFPAIESDVPIHDAPLSQLTTVVGLQLCLVPSKCLAARSGVPQGIGGFGAVLLGRRVPRGWRSCLRLGPLPRRPRFRLPLRIFEVQGRLAHQQQRPPLGPPWDPGYSPTIGS